LQKRYVLRTKSKRLTTLIEHCKNYSENSEGQWDLTCFELFAL